MVTKAEVPCYLCGEEVVNGDDYKIHVNIAHGVEYDEESVLSALDIDTNDKTATCTNVTLANESDISHESNAKSENRRSFFDMFDVKIKQIMDLAEGRIEPVSVEDDTVEIFDEKQIWQMFENVRTKVMNMDISEAIASTESYEERQISNDDSNSMNSNTMQEEKKWYQGTFYECNLCQNIFLGQECFRSHLKRNHKIESSSLKKLTEFSSHFEEKLYSCKLCEKKVKHEFKNIYMHMRGNHSLTMDEYESQFISAITDEVKISKKNQSQPVENLLKQPQQKTDKLNPQHKIEKLHPIKSELPNYNPPHQRPTQLRPVKSHAVKLQTVKSQATDFRAVQKSFRETLQPPPTTNTGTNSNTDVPTLSNPPMVKEEPVPISIPKALSFYYCPIPDCSFYTTKEGMKKSQAALHLKNDHKIKAKDMKPGMYKFDKIKV